MAIVSSTITANNVEIDGRRRVDELHIDDQGVRYAFTYLADVGFDVNAQLASRAAALPARATANEIAANIALIIMFGSLLPASGLSLKYSTAAQNASAVRVAYKTATQRDAIFIGDFLSSLTDVQLMAAFGLTQTQVTNQRTLRLTPAANTATAIRAALGA